MKAAPEEVPPDLTETLALVLAGFVLVVVALGAAFARTVGRPTVTFERVGEWVVDDEGLAVRSTLRVADLGPLTAAVADGATLAYRLELNGVPLASGERSDLALDAGTERVTLTTVVDTDRLPVWWAAYVAADETVDVTAAGSLTLALPIAPSVPVPAVSYRLADGETPIRDALSAAATDLVGEYTVDPTGLLGDLTGGLFDPGGPGAPVGYEIEAADIRWGEVTAERTTVVLDLTVSNPGPVPVPVVPAAVRLTAALNGRQLFATTEAGATLADAADPPLAPGERRTVSYPVTTATGDAADWFVDHVRAGERSTLIVRLGLAFEVPGVGTTVSVPADGVVTATREIETDILGGRAG